MSDNLLVKANIDALRASGEAVFRVIGQDLAPQHLFHPTGASRTHILWQTGHLVWAREFGVNATLAGAPTLSDDYTSLFGLRSQPEQDAMKYPTFERLLDDLRLAQDRTTALLEPLTNDDILRELPPSSLLRSLFSTIEAMLRGMVFHEGYHAGQITLLRRAQGLSSALGA